MWNLNSKEATASFGYDYVLRQCRLRGRIDTGGLPRRGCSSGVFSGQRCRRGWLCLRVGCCRPGLGLASAS